MGACRRHPVFARLYRRVSLTAERKGAGEHRALLLAGLTGDVVEIGAGNGLNFTHYPATVNRVTAVEPEPYLRRLAEDAGQEADVSITVVDGTAERLPLPDSSVDAAVVSLVLCSVADQGAVLTELLRVLRPGGELRFYEHVAASNPRWARRQQRVDPIWTRLAGGCHITRHTVDAIEAAGFEIDACDEFLFAPSLFDRMAARHVLGKARKLATPQPSA